MPRPKLLLADDSITIQKVVNLTFADQGMDVITFSDGDAAVENLDQVRPDIVLADVNMPGINGYQLCELMRSDEANKHIPVILLVGSFEPFDRDEAERVGSNGHLTKPFTSIAELVSTVQGLLASSAEMADSVEQTEVEEASGPDVSDIESLYQQSFVETVELPRDAGPGDEFDNGIDDEMIQTSYADPDPNAEAEETYFVADSSDNFSDLAEDEADLATEALIADSFPTDELAEESAFAAAAAESDYAANDPFESVAGDAPPVSDDVSVGDTIRFSFDDDLLELPGASRLAAVPANSTSSPEPKEITSLSPELIDLIVEKVVERLAKKY